MDTATIQTQFLDALLKGDRRTVLQLVDDALLEGHSVRELQLGVIERAQRRVGELWAENTVTIAQEHMATAIAQLALAHLFQYAPAPRAIGKKLLVACAEGELHDFPARLLADVLELSGFSVRFLGANVPIPPLLEMLRAEPFDLLALSATMPFTLPALLTMARAARAAFPDLPIIVGGTAALGNAREFDDLGLCVVEGDARIAVAETQRLLGVAAA